MPLTTDRNSPIAVCEAALPHIAGRGVPVPTYERRALTPRIAHIGVGGFHRAHLAVYTDELAGAGGDWAIRGLGLLVTDTPMAEALSAQDHLYTLVERGPGTPRAHVVGSIVDYRLVHDDADTAAALVADPDVRILSLTITEAGYASEGTAAPGDTFAVIADGLGRRRDAGSVPLTVVSCDNLPGNGDAARRSTLGAAAAMDAGLATWVDDECRFPNSMVDRITPATADADCAWLRDVHGIDDRWPVVAEPFRQWVIEDDFAADRPSWEDVGVLFTDRVHDWELYKLRLLNAGHSSMAYLAALAGITYVDEAVRTPEVRRFLDGLLYQEALPSLTEIPGHPRRDYVVSVLERFGNTGVRDQIARLCIDGAAKFPTFLLPTVCHHLDHDGPIARATTALAGWAYYLATVPVADQAFDTSADVARMHATAALADPVRFLEFDGVFPAHVRDHARFRTEFAGAWRHLAEHGPLAALGR